MEQQLLMPPKGLMMMKSLSTPLLSSAIATLILAALPSAFAQSADSEQELPGAAKVAAKVATEVKALPDFLKPVPENDIELRDIDPALWVIRDEDTVIYLFGTVHVLKPGLSWFDEAVKEAFDKSDTVVFETLQLSPGEMQSLFGKYALAADGVTVRSRLKGDDLANYEMAMKGAKFPAGSLDPFDPWAAAVTLQLTSLIAAGYDESSGVETQLFAAATASGKKLGQVETVDQQLSALDTLSMETQLSFLNQTTASMDSAVKELDNLVEDWGNGDIDGLAKKINAGFSQPELYKSLITRRNANWARWVKRRMNAPGTVFLAVGAGHLAGTVSLQNMLKAYKIDTQRIDY